MNEYLIKVNMKKGMIMCPNIELVQSDYNSTKFKFEFDEDYNEYTKLFRLIYPDKKTVWEKEIINNEVIISDVNENEEIVSVLTKPNTHYFNVTLYSDNSRLTTSQNAYFTVKDRQGITEVTPEEKAVIDDLINQATNAINEANSLNIESTKVDKTTTIIITKKDGTTVQTEILDGIDIADITEEPSLEDEGLNIITITLSDGTIYQLTVKNGSKGFKGDKGDNATVNGQETVNILEGENISITQEGQNLVINAIGGGSIEDVKVNGSSVVTDKVANINVPTKTSDLENDSNFAKTNENNNFTVGQTVNGTLTINGDIVQNGESYESHAEKLFTKNDVIITRDGAIGGLSDGEYTGIEAKNYDGENDGQLVFDNTGTARVGDKNDTQPLLTRQEDSELTDGQVLVYDKKNMRAIGSDEYVKNTDYPTSQKAGVVKTSGDYGIGSSNGMLIVLGANNSLIDSKTNVYRPITPANGDYFTMKTLTEPKKYTWTNEDKQKARDTLGAISNIDLPLREHTLSTPFVAQTEYYLGTVPQINIELPETAIESQYTLISFTAGTDFNIIIPSGVVGDADYIFVDGNTYEILLTYNGANWIMQVLEV